MKKTVISSEMNRLLEKHTQNLHNTYCHHNQMNIHLQSHQISYR